ncbi:hypothetical protein C2S51_013936 [Perilla frutescens var. frutescens]|nr:hypothetical protein C2S51_013936 [Perilla frutescens var. frutescens]
MAPFKLSVAFFPTVAVPEERTRRTELRSFALAGILRQLAACLELEARLLSWDFSHLRDLSFELWGGRKKVQYLQNSKSQIGQSLGQNDPFEALNELAIEFNDFCSKIVRIFPRFPVRIFIDFLSEREQVFRLSVLDFQLMGCQLSRLSTLRLSSWQFVNFLKLQSWEGPVQLP